MRDWRDRAELSQKSLAKLAGVSRATISMVERGERGVSWAVASKIAAALGLKPATIVNAVGLD